MVAYPAVSPERQTALQLHHNNFTGFLGPVVLLLPAACRFLGQAAMVRGHLVTYPLLLLKGSQGRSGRAGTPGSRQALAVQPPSQWAAPSRAGGVLDVCLELRLWLMGSNNPACRGSGTLANDLICRGVWVLVLQEDPICRGSGLK